MLQERKIGLAAISVDSAEDSAELTVELDLRLPLLSDPEMKVISAYGVAMAGKDIAVPATFIIRQDRTIHWQHVGETMADRPPTAELPDLADQAR